MARLFRRVQSLRIIINSLLRSIFPVIAAMFFYFMVHSAVVSFFPRGATRSSAASSLSSPPSCSVSFYCAVLPCLWLMVGQKKGPFSLKGPLRTKKKGPFALRRRALSH